MTDWATLNKDENKELLKLFNDITCGESSTCAPILREAILNPNKGSISRLSLTRTDKKFEAFHNGCWDFVHYQRKLYNFDANEFKSEGFVIGSPWHGDVLEAPILFLSSNPAITPYCLFPRWHPDKDPQKDSFSLGGTLGKVELNCKDDDGDTIRKYKNSISQEDIYDFFTNRFQESPSFIDHDGKGTAVFSVWVRDDNNPANFVRRNDAVSYWRGMRDVMRLLLNGVKGNTVPFQEDELCALMRPVLSAEFVPFGSMNEYGLNDELMSYYWENFAWPLLKNCGAKIIFLVGKYVREAFLKAVLQEKYKKKDDDDDPLNLNGKVLDVDDFIAKIEKNKNNKIVNGYKDWLKNHCIVFINNLGGRAPKNYEAAVESLRTMNDPIIQAALQGARDQYKKALEEAKKRKEAETQKSNKTEN